MNFIDKAISAFSPQWAFKRVQYRAALAAYEAGKAGRLRKDLPDNSSADALTEASGENLRGYARILDQNHDLSKGVLNTLVNNIVGPNGISIEPQPQDRRGRVIEPLANQLMDLWKDWSIRPEVTWCHDWATVERLICRTWLRDGEQLIQLLDGNIRTLDHGTRVRFSIELIEADLLPIDLDNEKQGIIQGVEKNTWGRPRAFHIYKEHPGDNNFRFSLETKRVPAEWMLHPKLVDRIRQTRGVSVFASVMRRLEDLKDYEESERIAARVAAAMTAFIKKGNPTDYVAPKSGKTDRHFSLKPGMVFDSLTVGEEVGTIQSNRPSILLEPFRNAMVRMISAGTGASYSSTAKDYNGSYSSQRQELVESWGNYESLMRLHVGMVTRPIWQAFVRSALFSGHVKIPRSLNPDTLYDADYLGPSMPWIDPDKETKANERAVRSGHASDQQIIRKRGGNPETVRRQIKQWRDKNDEDGLIFTTDPKHEMNLAKQAVKDESESEEENIDEQV